MGRFLESVGNKIPTLVGIKFYGNNLEEAFQALRADNGRFVIFLGNDEVKNCSDFSDFIFDYYLIFEIGGNSENNIF